MNVHEPSPELAPAGTLGLTPQPVRFVQGGRIRTVQGLPPTTTVLQWLREHAGCTGTKEGCAEGDCGACTVVLAEADPQDPGRLRQRTVNACLQFLPTLDGKALFTVEDVAAPASPAGAVPLHPCQQALVDCHGSQCGFCTPGFVMSLWQLYQQNAVPLPRTDVAHALSGNLCRCTGYRPILDAAAQMYQGRHQPLDPAPTLALLAGLKADPTDAATHAEPPTHIFSGPDADRPHQQARFIAPTTLRELARWREALPEARLLAGSTDIGLWVAKQFRPLGDILWLGRVVELQSVGLTPAGAGQPRVLDIGAGASLEAAWGALCRHVPALAEIWKRFASPPVRHAGTLGGNVANGSPIGDGPPVLLALDACVLLRRGDATRQLPLSDFYLGYMKNALQPGEFLQAIRVPLPEAKQVVRAWKVSKRRDSDISAVCGAFRLTLSAPDARGQVQIEAARVAFGGLDAVARRSAATEAALQGQAWNTSTLRAAQAALRADFTPLDDLRASATYRLDVAVNLLERLWLETRPDAPLTAGDVTVWPCPPDEPDLDTATPATP